MTKSIIVEPSPPKPGDKLWLLTIEDGWPVHAHLVANHEDRRRWIMECGYALDRAFHGAWWCRPDHLPLQEHAICPVCLDIYRSGE